MKGLVQATVLCEVYVKGWVALETRDTYTTVVILLEEDVTLAIS